MTRLSQRVQSMLRMTMTDVADAADAADGAFRLENADTWLTPPEHVLEATRAAVGDDDHNSYLPLRGLRPLREAIAARYAADRGIHYDPDREIVVTCGAGESLLNALLVLIDSGDRVLLTNPTYSGMAQRVRLAGGEQVFTSLTVRDGRWALDLDEARERARDCRVLFFASPCMPVGTVFTEQETACERQDAGSPHSPTASEARLAGRGQWVRMATAPAGPLAQQRDDRLGRADGDQRRRGERDPVDAGAIAGEVAALSPGAAAVANVAEHQAVAAGRRHDLPRAPAVKRAPHLTRAPTNPRGRPTVAETMRA